MFICVFARFCLLVYCRVFSRIWADFLFHCYPPRPLIPVFTSVARRQNFPHLWQDKLSTSLFSCCLTWLYRFCLPLTSPNPNPNPLPPIPTLTSTPFPPPRYPGCLFRPHPHPPLYRPSGYQSFTPSRQDDFSRENQNTCRFLRRGGREGAKSPSVDQHY